MLRGTVGPGVGILSAALLGTPVARANDHPLCEDPDANPAPARCPDLLQGERVIDGGGDHE